MRFALQVVWTGAAIALSSGCFSYKAAELGSVHQGTEVRVQLTREGFAALSDLPMESGPRLTGTLVSSDASQLRVRVPLAAERLTTTVAQEFEIPAGAIVQLERRELNRTRTAIVVGGAVATVVGFYLGFEKGNPFKGDDPKEPETEGPGVRTVLRRVIGFSIPVR